MALTRWFVASACVAILAGGLTSCSTEMDPEAVEYWDEGGDFGEELAQLSGAFSINSNASCCTPEPNDLGGCNDTGCTSCVCALDPYCCGAEWDALCVDRSASSDQCLGACKCTTQCLAPPADVNGSSDVNVLDVQCVLLVSLWELQGSPASSTPICLAHPAYKADLNCSGTTNVGDVLVAIPLALDLSLELSIDANQDDCPDACVFPPPDPCSLGQSDCDDGDRCTENDKCSGATCQGTAKNCDDNNACTSDHCDSDGPLGGTNTYGSCYHNDISWTCTDDFYCTTNYCDTALGCIVEPVNANCDDGKWCTGSDVTKKVTDLCVIKHYDANGDGVISSNEHNLSGGDAGGCSYPDIAYQCNDGLPCTADSCNNSNGCHNDYKCPGTPNGGNSCHNTGIMLAWGLPGSVNTGPSIMPGTCYTSSCNSAYFDFDAAYSNGCECSQDAFDLNNLPGNSSTDPHDLGDLDDNAAKIVQVGGNLLSKTSGADSDWYTFYGVDGPDNVSCGGGNTGDNYHVRVRFIDNPAGFKFNLFRNGTQACTADTDYEDKHDYINIVSNGFNPGVTDGNVNIYGECPCTFSDGVNNMNMCQASGGNTYLVEVFRPSDVTIGCDNYLMEFSNGYY